MFFLVITSELASTLMEYCLIGIAPFQLIISALFAQIPLFPWTDDSSSRKHLSWNYFCDLKTWFLEALNIAIDILIFVLMKQILLQIIYKNWQILFIKKLFRLKTNWHVISWYTGSTCPIPHLSKSAKYIISIPTTSVTCRKTISAAEYTIWWDRRDRKSVGHLWNYSKHVI